MTLDTRAFSFAAGATAGMLFSLCAAAVAVAPGATTAFLGLILHLDLTGVVRPLTLPGFLVGLVTWTLGTGLTFGLAAVIYNRVTGDRTGRAG